MKEVDKVKELPKFAVKFANTVFTLGILCSVLIVIYAAYKMYSPPELRTNTFYILCILFGAFSTVLFSLGLRLNNSLKVNLSVLFITIVIVVYVFEIYSTRRF